MIFLLLFLNIFLWRGFIFIYRIIIWFTLSFS